MTPTELTAKVQALRARLGRVKKVQIGMGNYKQVLEAYQELLEGTMSSVEELSVMMAALLPSQKDEV